MSPRPPATSAMPWSSLLGSLRTYAIFTLDSEGVIDSWNEGVRELLGYEEHEFVGQNGNIIFTLEDRAKRVAEWELGRARERGEAIDDRWHLRKDGSRLWVNGIMYCVRDEAGAVVGFLKIMRDQTEKRAVDESLEESEERFSKAFRGNPTPIAIIARSDRRIVDINAAFTRAFRMERPEAIGRTLGELGVDAAEGAFEQVRDEVSRGRTAQLEAQFTRSDGEIGYGTFAFEPIELGGAPHAVMMMHDITEWRRTTTQLEQQHDFVNAILNSLPGVFYMMDGQRLVQWNDEFERVTGRTTAELATATTADLVVEVEAVREHIETAFRTGYSSMEGHLRTSDGTLVPYLLTGRRVEREGRPLVLGVGVEAREQVRARQTLERQAREQGAFADLAAEALAADELQTVLELAVKRVAETLDAEHVHIVEPREDGTVVRAGLHQVDAETDDPERIENARTEESDEPSFNGDAGAWPTEVLAPLGLKSGIRARILGRGRAIGYIEALSEREDAFSDEDVRFLRSVAYLLAGAVQQDRLYQELEHRAEHDDLTGLLTRVAFEERLVDALARAERSNTKVAALFLDLDRFKNVNDSLGHQAGDEVLRTVARRLRDAVRSWDVVARHGGDEFVLFLPDIESSSEIAHVTNRLLDAFSEPFTVAGRELRIGTTVGIASFPDDGDDARALLRAADTALYEGKARGRNTFHFFTREQNERVLERLELETFLHQALDRDEFEVEYLPQIDLRDDAVRVAEALIRWRHPAHGDLAPSSFLPIAEAIGLAVPIGEWTLRRAFADHASWRGLPDAPERVAVNVSSLHVLQPSFPETLMALAHEADVTPNEIEIEFTEATLLKDPELVADHLRALHEVGIGIVIDDFGTSASPLARLRFLPIDRLKIDETFTHRLDDPRGRRLLEAIVQVAHGLGIEPVAEGIESREQHDAVTELGFGAAQGRYYLGPQPRELLLDRLKERSS